MSEATTRQLAMPLSASTMAMLYGSWPPAQPALQTVSGECRVGTTSRRKAAN